MYRGKKIYSTGRSLEDQPMRGQYLAHQINVNRDVNPPEYISIRHITSNVKMVPRFGLASDIFFSVHTCNNR